MSRDPTLCLTARHIPALIYGSESCRPAERIAPSARTQRGGSAAPHGQEPTPSHAESPPPKHGKHLVAERGLHGGDTRQCPLRGAPGSSVHPGAVRMWPRMQRGGRGSPQPPPCSLFSVTILNNCQRGRGQRGGGYKYEHVTPQARTVGPCTARRPHLWGHRSDPPSGHARHADPAAPSGRVGCNPSPKPLRKVRPPQTLPEGARGAEFLARRRRSKGSMRPSR